jgi:membrane protease YdiL (CAAX protease family)
MWFHALVAAALLLRGSRATEHADGHLYLALSIMPLVRIVSYSISPHFVPGVWFYVAAEIPLLLAATSATRVLHLPLSALGWQRPRSLAISALIVLSGIPAGWAEGFIIHPPALASGLHPARLVLPALLLIACTGFVEETVFRGLIQYTAMRYLGTVQGILLTTVGWSMLHIGWGSAEDVGFVFLAGIVWGWARYWNRSTLDLGLAHGAANVVLFLVLPNLR